MKKHSIPLKKIAVWLDHAQARLILPGEVFDMTQTIYSGIDSRVREDGEGTDTVQVGRFRSTNSEHNQNEKTNRQLKAFYTRVAKAIEAYDEILLFGPTTAGEELFNFLLRTRRFTGKPVHLQKTGYQTDRQLIAFVKKALA